MSYSMILITLAILGNILIASAQKKCDNQGVLLYEDMACTPKGIESTGCPLEYNCPHLTSDKDKCYYKNMTYEIGDLVRHPDRMCDVACFCQGEGLFGCGIVDCAEYFGVTPPPGCYRTHSLRTCCSDGQECGESPGTCTFEGQTYRYGERFFPNTSCSMCVCQEGFRGKIEEPFCTSRKCNVQLKRGNRSQQKCAPFYSYKVDLENHILCCPSDWICPNGTEVINGSAKSDKTCSFSDTTLKHGQYVEKETGLIIKEVAVCECRVPPLLTCIPKKDYPF